MPFTTFVESYLPSILTDTSYFQSIAMPLLKGVCKTTSSKLRIIMAAMDIVLSITMGILLSVSSGTPLLSILALGRRGVTM